MRESTNRDLSRLRSIRLHLQEAKESCSHIESFPRNQESIHQNLVDAIERVEHLVRLLGERVEHPEARSE